jgi:hypothetical protein
MTGYTVTARIQRVELRSPATRAFVADQSSGSPVPMSIADVALEELEGDSAWARLLGWRDDLTASWRQTTFFLFDPESWR